MAGSATRSSRCAATWSAAASSTQADVDGTIAAAKALMADIGTVLLEPMPGGKPGQRRIKAAEWPDPAFVDVGVRGDLSEFDDAPLADRDTFTGELAETEVHRRRRRR